MNKWPVNGTNKETMNGKVMFISWSREARSDSIAFNSSFNVHIFHKEGQKHFFQLLWCMFMYDLRSMQVQIITWSGTNYKNKQKAAIDERKKGAKHK